MINYYGTTSTLTKAFNDRYEKCLSQHNGDGDTFESCVSLIADYDICIDVLNMLVRDYGFDIYDIELEAPESTGYTGPHIITIDCDGDSECLWVQRAIYEGHESIVNMEDAYVFVQHKWVANYVINNADTVYEDFDVTDGGYESKDYYYSSKNCDGCNDCNVVDSRDTECEYSKTMSDAGDNRINYLQTIYGLKTGKDGSAISISFSTTGKVTKGEYETFSRFMKALD